MLGLAVLARPAFPERARRRSPTEHPMALDSVCVCRSPSALRRATGSVGRCHVSTQSRQSFIFCEARARHTRRAPRGALRGGAGGRPLPPPPLLASRRVGSARSARRPIAVLGRGGRGAGARRRPLEGGLAHAQPPGRRRFVCAPRRTGTAASANPPPRILQSRRTARGGRERRWARAHVTGKGQRGAGE